MRDTLLANIGCLCVFQVAGSDARQLVWELDRERVSEEDVVSLPVHHAYVRATVGSERTPAFSMEVLRPDGGSPSTAERIRDEASAYLLTEEEVAALQEEGRRRVDEFRERLEDERNKDGAEPEQGDGTGEAGRGDARSKHFQPPRDRSAEDGA